VKDDMGRTPADVAAREARDMFRGHVN
jgi:hypothetical protein